MKHKPSRLTIFSKNQFPLCDDVEIYISSFLKPTLVRKYPYVNELKIYFLPIYPYMRELKYILRISYHAKCRIYTGKGKICGPILCGDGVLRIPKSL